MVGPKVTGPAASRLPQFVDSFYEQLKADYEAAKLPLDSSIQNPGTWDGLYRLEMATLRARTGQELRRSAWLVRLRFRNVAGEAAYTAYLASLPPDPVAAEEATLLADLVNLLRRTYYLLALAPSSEAIRHTLIMGGAAIGVACIIGIVIIIVKVPDIGLFQLALVAGAIGGTMSLIQRVQSLPEADPLLFRLSGTTTVIQSLVIPPLTGAIFAALLFLIFVSGVVSGDIFPKFISTNVLPTSGKGVDFQQFFMNTAAFDGKSFALSIIWSFIAGFAERFVPNTINRLTAQASGEKDPPAPIKSP